MQLIDGNVTLFVEMVLMSSLPRGDCDGGIIAVCACKRKNIYIRFMVATYNYNILLSNFHTIATIDCCTKSYKNLTFLPFEEKILIVIPALGSVWRIFLNLHLNHFIPLKQYKWDDKLPVPIIGR